MKAILSFFIASCVVCVSVAQAGLNITDSQHQVYSKFSGDGSNGGFSDNAANALNSVVNTQDGGTLGFKGAKGDYEYDYTTSNAVSIAGNNASLSVSAAVDFSALSKSATVAHGEEGVGAFLDFKITGQDYVGTLNFTSLLSATNSVGNSSLSSFSFLLKNGSVFESFSNSINNTGATSTFSTTPFPANVLLTPGDYRLYVGLNGLRDGTYNLPNLSMSGTSSLVLTAVPEPATMILWSCVGAFGAPKLRRYLKRRKSVKI